MKNPIQLVNYQFIKFNCNWNDGANSEKNRIAMDYSVAINNKNPNLYRLDFLVLSTPQEDSRGITLDVHMQGFFQFAEGISKEEMETILRINGSTILYGALRGHVSSMTACFPGGSVLLPTIIMQDVVEQIEANKQAASKEGME